MKQFLLAMAVLIFVGQMALATTTDQMRLTVGSVTCTFSDNTNTTCTDIPSGTSLNGDFNPANGKMNASGTIGGWEIDISGGTSHSPNTQQPVFGLDLTVVSATCTGGDCTTTPLHVSYTDMDFNNPAIVFAEGFRHHYSANISGDGTTTGSAYYDNGDVNFTESVLINAIGPFSDPGGANTLLGPPAGTALALYSMTLDDVFTSAGTGTSFSTDDSITANVPEPVAVALFGTVIALCASRLRRRKTV